MKTASPTARALLLVLTTFGLPIASHAAVGRTPGTFAVSATGAATYSIPISVPPGPNGLQPHLALTYNHHQGAGPLGVGWSLSGLSAISRCKRTYAQDGTPASVSLTYNDAFCLDGKRLRLTSSETLSTYGQDGTTYQTEVADFSNITAHGAAGNGPAYFTVQRRDGLTYEYGNGGNSQVVATGSSTASAWLLDKITDRAGNTMIVAYSAPASTLTGTTVPTSISWTPSSAGSSTYNYTVQFDYNTSNTPASSIFGYIGGTSVVNQDLLLDITIVNNTSSTTVKKYGFTYGSSPTTGALRLSQVIECADSAETNCLLPTTIAYENGTVGVSSSFVTAATNVSQSASWMNDFNGDGYRDVIYTSANTLYVQFGSPSGYGPPISTNIAASNAGDVGDVLGNGSDQIFATINGSCYLYAWNPSTSSFTSTPVSACGTLVDVNGDGLPDIVTSQTTYNALTQDNEFHIQVRLNTSANGIASFSSTVTDNVVWSGNCSYNLLNPSSFGGQRHVDFDGDGREDMMMFHNCLGAGHYTVGYALLLANGTSFNYVAFGPTTTTPVPPTSFINWNNDACTDILFSNHVYVSGCNGTTPISIPITGTVLTALDWDGDGRTDVLVANGNTIGVLLSTGVGVSALTPTTVPFSSDCLYRKTDIDGDGLDDLGCWAVTGDTVSYSLHNGSGVIPDLLSSISDGYGIAVSPSYVSITRGNYTKGSGAPSGEKDIATPYTVVSQAVASDGIGGTYTKTYTYTGARQNLLGYGFEGFQSRTETDNRTNSLGRTTWHQTSFPFTGMISQENVYQHDMATLVSHTLYSNSNSVLDSTAGNRRQFVFLQSESVQQYEVGGPKNAQLIATTSSNYSYDNYGNATNFSTTVTDNDSGSPYAGQQWTTATATTITPDTGTNWCLTQPSEVQVTKSAPGVPSITRTVSYSPDYAHCREGQEVTEPSNPTYAVTQILSYDSFGNISGVQTTGAGMNPRSTAINWGATGQFPTSTTNALGQTSFMSFDPNFGVQTSQTDPNGTLISWQYDAFGRRTRETRPDSTYTVWAYYDCASDGGCLIGPHAVALARSVYNSDGSVQTDGTTYYDQLDRPLIANRRMLVSGNYDRNEVRYDNFGRLLSEAMPCVWSSVGASCPYWKTNTFDALGRVIQTQRPISSSNTSPQTTSTLYEGRTIVTTDAQGKQSIKIVTVADTLARTQDNNGYYQNFTYDAFGSLLSVTDSLSNALFSATYDYGLQAYQRSLTDVDLGSRAFTYDALGELVSYSDGKGQSFSITYDALSRPLVRSEPDLTTTWTWGNAPSSYNVGRLASVSANSYSENFTYDRQGRITNRSVTIPSDGTYGYDFAYSSTTGLLDTLTYPVSTSGYRLELQYHYQNGILQSITDYNAQTAYWTANATNARGQITTETLGNGVVTNRSFDAVTGWLGAIQSGVNGGTALQNDSYLFDYVGNLTQRQNNNVGLTENFYYDNVYRLDHSALNGTVNLQMAYDATGNITSRSDVAGGATWTYDPNRKHAVTQAGNSSFVYTYDANGNMSSRNGYTVSWTSYNHPLSISALGQSVQFDYDQSHERWRTVYSGPNGTETTYLIGNLLEKVVMVGDTDFRHYVFAGPEKVAIVSRTASGLNTVRYVREDHLGGVSGIENAGGTNYVKESFTAFGNRRNSCTWSGSPTSGQLNRMAAATRHGFTWHMALGTMGLNDMNGRIQDSMIGRFLSADPVPPAMCRTQTWNRYSYVNNNPLSYIDPSGFADQPAVDFPYDQPPTPDPEQTVTVTGSRNSDTGSYQQVPGTLGNAGGGDGGGDPPPLDTVTVTGQRSMYASVTTVVSLAPITINLSGVGFLSPSEQRAIDRGARASCMSTCLASVHVLAATGGGAVGGLITGGLPGAAVGASVGLVAGGLDVATGTYQPGVAGGVIEGGAGAAESAMNGESAMGGAIAGAVRGYFGEMFGIGAAAGAAAGFGDVSTRGFVSLTPGARSYLSLATRGILTGVGATMGLITQLGIEAAGEHACESLCGPAD